MAEGYLPGERVERTLRPHPWSRWPHDLLGLALVVLGLSLGIFFRSSWWTGGQACSWKFWHCLTGNAVMAYVVTLAVLAALGALAALWAQRRSLLYAHLALGVAAVLFTAIWLGNDPAVGAPVSLAAAGLAIVAWAEADRRRQQVTVTNLRILWQRGLVRRRTTAVHHAAVADLDPVQGVVGRWLDVGGLLPVLADGQGLRPGVVLRGLAPFGQVREHIGRLVREATTDVRLRKAEA